MDFTESLKGFIFKAFIAFLSLCTLLWLSIIFYGLLYYLYIPAVAHIRPVHLQYDISCFREKHCQYPKFPFNNITLNEDGNEFLRGGQGYAIELVLEMPESERNWNQGIFMIKLDMINFEGKLIKSTSRSAMLRYRSPLFKILYTIFFIPGLLAGSFEEKQSLVIPLFENYIENSYNNAHFAHVEIQAQSIEVYSSTLRIHAQFTGLRYLMYYWPVLSAVVGVGMNFVFLVSTIGLIWFYESTKTPNNNEMDAGASQGFIRFLSRNRRTNELSGSKIPVHTNVPFSERETFENKPEQEEIPRCMGVCQKNMCPTETEVKNMDIQDICVKRISDNLPSGEDSQMEGRTTGIQREIIGVENIPRHRSAPNELRDND